MRRLSVASIALLTLIPLTARAAPSTDPRANESPPAEGPSTTTRTFPGILLPDQNALIKSRWDGQVDSVAVVVGSSAREGQALIRLADDEARFSRDRAAALLEQARADLARIRRLHDESLTSDEALESGVTGLKLAEADYHLAAQRLEECTIRAPFAGVIAELYVDAGTSVEEGDRLVRVTALRPLRLETFLPEEMLSRFSGRTFITVTPAYPETTLRVPVELRSRVVDPSSGTFQLQVWLANRDGRLVPGVSCHVTVPAPSAEVR